MDFGSTIKAAREARGLSVSQVAAQTRILVQTIEDMERNVFKRIPAPIYGRGFVKLICECLDLDPVTMVPAFMAAFNGEPQIPDEPAPRDGGIRYAEPEEDAPPQPVLRQFAQETQSQLPPVQQPPVQQPPAAEPQPAESTPSVQEEEQAPAAEPPPPMSRTADVDSSLRGLELFDPATAKEAPPAQAPQPEGDFSRFAPPTRDDRGFSRFAPPSAEDDFSRFASPLPDDEPSASPLDRFREGFSAVSSGVLGQVKKFDNLLAAKRIALLAVCGLIVLALCGWGIVALFRATSGGGADALPGPAAVREAEQQPGPGVASAPAGAKDAAKPAPAPAPAAEADVPAAPAKPSVPLKLPGFYVD